MELSKGLWLQNKRGREIITEYMVIISMTFITTKANTVVCHAALKINYGVFSKSPYYKLEI